jgi:glucuronide carrier protein
MKLRAQQLLGYAAGDAANNLAFSMASMFLLLYYTDVAGIPAAAAGTLFLIVRVWDGVADLVAGRLVDRTSSRWGKFRPWLLFGSLPLLLLSVATFSVPDGSLTAKLIYAYLT